MNRFAILVLVVMFGIFSIDVAKAVAAVGETTQVEVPAAFSNMRPVPEAGGNDTQNAINMEVHKPSMMESLLLARSLGGLTSTSSWMPLIISTMKKSLNYLGTSKEFGVGGAPFGGGDNGVGSVVTLLALVTIATFLLFLLQPMFMHPKKRRMSRRLRGNPSPFSYKSPTYWGRPEGKHMSSDSRPMIVPGPALMPVAVPVPISVSGDSDDDHDETSAQKQTRSKRIKNKDKSSGKGYTSGGIELESIDDYGPPSKYSEDKLTKEEIMYILKSLND